MLGGDYVTWGDRRVRRRRPPKRSRRCRRRTASSASSATTTTITTCRRRSRSSGVQVLKDARTRLHDQRRNARPRRHPVLDEAPDRHRRADARRDGADDVLLAHDPRRLTEAAALNIPLVLSGHTHGGQVVLPGRRRGRRAEISGRRRARPPRTNTTMFVSRGVGTVYVPVRINCPPEVAVLTLAARDCSRHVDADSSGLNRRPSIRQPPVEHQFESPRDRAGAPRPGCAPTACRRVSSSSTGTAACSDDRPAVELGGHEVHRRAATRARHARAPAAARRARETPAAATGGC